MLDFSKYLEEKYPQRALLPAEPQLKALNLQKYLEQKVGPQESLLFALEKGFNALEKLLKDINGKYATGDEVYMADVFMAPQIAAAMQRFKIDMVNESLNA
ncbi:glutathione S-transferase zeta class-like [Gossypium australe]|uniref:Glutathione S-transferase zeta class-like n=1 Tax=Gossypium australe TaxID=47621 RepID=A0A5B6UVK0_9ROSI|nr:glutathione S-transferase zeta class-like [Gossypium australe]